MPPISTAIWGLPSRGLACLPGRVLDRLHDVHVAGAAAEIAGDGLTDLELARVRIRGQKCRRGDHHPGGAEAALEAVLLVESLLYGVELAILLEAFDRRDAHPIRLHREHGARLHRPFVQQHGAGAAVRGVAADMRAGHAEVLTEEVDEERARLDLDVVGLTVDGHVDLHASRAGCGGRRRFNRHQAPPFARAIALTIARLVRTRKTSFL